MLDTDLIFAVGKEFANRFPNVNKILTIEASGIAFAVATAFHLNNIPIVFARKTESLITTNEVYTYPVMSFTKQVSRDIIVSKKFLDEKDKVLIIDDFLAHGEALNGLIEVCKQAKATIIGAGIVIEKVFQGGRDKIAKHDVEIYSLAPIKEIKNNKLIF
jgi:xanthine phosphoribosyltransferase